MKRICALALMLLVFSGCNTPASAPVVSAQIVGEWESEDRIAGGAVAEIGGRKYLFLMTAENVPIPSRAALRVLDVEDPAAPVEVGTLAAPEFILLGFPGGIKPALADNVLYVPLAGFDWGGLWVVDVSDPTSPREITLLDAQYSAIDLALSGNIAYIAGYPSGYFLLVDVADPAHPQEVGVFRLSREQHVRLHSQDTDVSGSWLYVVERDGLDIVDISSPSSPREVSFYPNPIWIDEEPLEGTGRSSGDPLPDGFHDVDVSGQYAYIAAGKSGLRVLDVSNPASPQEVAQLDVPETTYRIDVAGNLVYLLGVELVERVMTHRVRIIDISEPDSPEMVDSVELSRFPSLVSLVGIESYIYIMHLRTLQVIDVYASNGGR